MNTHKLFQKKIFFSVILFTLLCIVAQTVPLPAADAPQKYLVLYSREKRRVLWREPVATGDTVQLRFIMSLYKVPQWEVYTVDKDNVLIVEKMICGSYEAMQYFDKLNQFYAIGNGMYERILGNKTQTVRFRMGFKADHCVLVHGKEFYVSNVAHAGEALSLYITAKLP